MVEIEFQEANFTRSSNKYQRLINKRGSQRTLEDRKLAKSGQATKARSKPPNACCTNFTDAII